MSDPRSSNQSKYESKNIIKQFLLNRFLKRVLEIIDYNSPGSLLDIGCGEGLVLKRVENRSQIDRLVGVDISGSALKKARENVDTADLYKMSANSLDFKKNEFDMVIMLEVLEHLKDPLKAIKEAKRVGNSCVFSVPNEPLFSILSLFSGSYIKRFGRHPEHLNFWSATEFKKLVSSQFQNVELFSSIPWTIVVARK